MKSLRVQLFPKRFLHKLNKAVQTRYKNKNSYVYITSYCTKPDSDAIEVKYKIYYEKDVLFSGEVVLYKDYEMKTNFSTFLQSINEEENRLRIQMCNPYHFCEPKQIMMYNIKTMQLVKFIVNKDFPYCLTKGTVIFDINKTKQSCVLYSETINDKNWIECSSELKPYLKQLVDIGLQKKRLYINNR